LITIFTFEIDESKKDEVDQREMTADNHDQSGWLILRVPEKVGQK
jgi:hypothetical protein